MGDSRAPAGVALGVEQSAGQEAAGQLERRQWKTLREQGTWGTVGIEKIRSEADEG